MANKNQSKGREELNQGWQATKGGGDLNQGWQATRRGDELNQGRQAKGGNELIKRRQIDQEEKRRR